MSGVGGVSAEPGPAPGPAPAQGSVVSESDVSERRTGAAVRLAVIEHEAGTDARRLGEWLESAGAQLTVFRPYLADAQGGAGSERDVHSQGDAGSPGHVVPGLAPVPASDPQAGPGGAAASVSGRLPGPEEFDGLVVLGGSMGPADDEDHPWMPGTRELLAASAAGAFPALAVCLGGEQLCLAAGAGVREREVPQIGVGTAVTRPEARTDPLFSQLPAEFPVLLWHGIEMTLPDGAVHLIEGTDAPVQAFRCGEAWGTQFHPESTGEQLRVWGTLGGAPSYPGGRSLEDVVAEAASAQEAVAETMEPLAHAFVAYVRQFDRMGMSRPADCG